MKHLASRLRATTARRSAPLSLCLWLLLVAACEEDETGPQDTKDASATGITGWDASGPPGPLATGDGSVDLPTTTSFAGQDAATNLDADVPTAPPSGTGDAGAPVADGGVAAAGVIETVMVVTSYVYGVGGSLTLDASPLILFKDGSACRDMNFVVEGLDVPTHKAMYPRSWTSWKLFDGKVALANGTKWVYLDYQLRYPPLPQGQVFDGKFMRLTGGGNTSVGGDVLIVAQAVVRFFPDHRFVQGSFAGVTSSATVALSTPPDQQGSYEIDGYQIQLRYDDGKLVRTSLVWTPNDPQALYLSGRSYVVSN